MSTDLMQNSGNLPQITREALLIAPEFRGFTQVGLANFVVSFSSPCRPEIGDFVILRHHTTPISQMYLETTGHPFGSLGVVRAVGAASTAPLPSRLIQVALNVSSAQEERNTAPNCACVITPAGLQDSRIEEIAESVILNVLTAMFRNGLEVGVMVGMDASGRVIPNEYPGTTIGHVTEICGVNAWGEATQARVSLRRGLEERLRRLAHNSSLVRSFVQRQGEQPQDTQRALGHGPVDVVQITERRFSYNRVIDAAPKPERERSIGRLLE